VLLCLRILRLLLVRSYEARKVHPIFLEINEEAVPLAISGGAGDAALVKQLHDM